MATPLSARRMQLSPTASAFTPGGIARDIFATFPQAASHPQISDLTARSEPDASGSNGVFAHRMPGDFGPIGGARVIQTSFPMMYCQVGQFDYENRNRAFAIEGAPLDMPYQVITTIFDVCELPSAILYLSWLCLMLISFFNTSAP